VWEIFIRLNTQLLNTQNLCLLNYPTDYTEFMFTQIPNWLYRIYDPWNSQLIILNWCYSNTQLIIQNLCSLESPTDNTELVLTQIPNWLYRIYAPWNPQLIILNWCSLKYPTDYTEYMLTEFKIILWNLLNTFFFS
jgi:hypothetical protein